MALRNQPYLPLYVQDFMSDEKLRECSAESVGVYIFLMCIMHKSEEYGKIKLLPKYFCSSKNQAGACEFANMLAKHMPFPLLTIEHGLTELLQEKVIQLDGDILIQKRMVKDCDISTKRAIAGSDGGKKRVKNLATICSSKNQAKVQANSEYENEYDIDNDNTNNTDNEEEKEKKKKLEEQRLKQKAIDECFEIIWNEYPRKRGKGSVSDTKKEKLYNLGIDKIKTCIDRYKQELIKLNVDEKHTLNGSTFFNSGYVDYLDENYVEQEQTNTKGGMKIC
jgi:uncharacterized protein YdaU (DUF1376 family)